MAVFFLVMIITTDDLCLAYLDNFVYFDRLKKVKPDLSMIAFAIGNFQNKERLQSSQRFLNWFDEHKDWVEIAVHSYDHNSPPDGDREDEKYWIKKARDSLELFLPERYGYRSPGWQTTNKTVSILKELGFSYIAYESKMVDIQKKTIIDNNILNSHLYDVVSIRRIHEIFENSHQGKS